MIPELIDTHAHLYGEEFDADRADVLCRARETGVERLLLPAIDSATHDRLFALCRAEEDFCIPMMGLHPTSVNDNPRWRAELDLVERLLASPPDGIRFCGVGEIGLDFYWNADFRAEQTEAFRRQAELALAFDLPVAIHTRSAWPETLQLVREYAGRGLRGVFHAFSGSVEIYRALRACGDFLFGIGGVVTFRRSALAETVRGMSLDDLVLETDSPYLTPVPHRGERNEPTFVRHVCERIAELLGLDPAEVAARTAANARRMFGLRGVAASAGGFSAPEGAVGDGRAPGGPYGKQKITEIR